MGGLDRFHRVFYFTAEELIEIQVESGSGGIDGVLRSLESNGIPEVSSASRVVLVPAPPRERNINLYRTTTIAAVTGTFSFSDVPPGDYLVFAWYQPAEIFSRTPLTSQSAKATSSAWQRD